MLQIFGQVPPPPGVSRWGDFSSGGFVEFMNAILRLLIVAGGIWVMLNIIIAGYQFIGASGNPEKVSAAWAKIWQSLLGLLFIAGAFVIAAIIGQIVFGDPRAIIDPKIIGPQ